MAEVAFCDFSAPVSFPFEKCASKVQSDAAMKRKTLSDLRGEQLKQRQCARPADESATSLLDSGPSGCNVDGAVNGIKKLESSKAPKYIDTRVDEVYAVKKSSDMFRMLYGKEKAKVTSPSTEQANDPKKLSACNLAAKSRPFLSCGMGKIPNIFDCATASARENAEQVSQQTVEKCVQSTFRNVAELSLGSKALSGPGIIDMDKALKGLVAREPPAVSSSVAEPFERLGDLPSVYPGNFCHTFHIPGVRAPLDFTLKSNVRLVSSSSMSWCRKLSTTGSYEGIAQFMSEFSHTRDQNCVEGGDSLGHNAKAEALYYKALHSWSFPQSSLPPSVVSAMALSAARGGLAEMDFLSKRQLAWEDSFRSIYYLLRRKKCNMFYLYTSHFVVMFIGGVIGGKTKYSCNAYLSQSTRGLRALLREHDVRFTMPLCRSEIEQATTDDLLELSEFERKNPGQTHHLDFTSHVDSSSQSLLAFIGNENVHGLYEFLLNYRSFLHSLTNGDVPVLYSPIAFQNASLCIPELRCKQMKRVDAVLCAPRGSHMENCEESSSGICYSVEIKDAILPPWIINRFCMAMGSEGSTFEASFTTDPLSLGLNIALDSVCAKADPLPKSDQSSPQNSCSICFAEAIVDPRMRLALLNGLKFSDSSYVAHLSLA